ncbi:MAG: SGNH/GDSL hydrolase family protein [Planctomycetota bacterium]|nr:MAG: SGNH/GDSL hydrolase family protein [Planctomycetota bacterium]
MPLDSKPESTYRSFLVLLLTLMLAAEFVFVGWLSARGADDDDPVLRRIDAIYADMQPLEYDPPADRWQHIPRTIDRLRFGPKLKVVMLGDSIVNDTSRSGWEKLVERMYPRCTIEKITSVRGSTGCWYYRDPEQLETYVLRHKPDLLMIGGISHRNDIESIRAVIRQVREALNPDPEIILMTPVFGPDDPRDDPDWSYAVPGDDSFRARLKRLAEEEQVEFLDMTGPWGRYIRTCGEDIHWFKRDYIHANAKGEAILGRILERYFAPKTPQQP